VKKIIPIAQGMIVSIFFIMTAFTACSARKGFSGGPCMMGHGGGGTEHGGGMTGPGDMSSHSRHDQGSMSSHSGHEHGGVSQGQPMNQDQAKILVEDYLTSTRNPNLRLGDIFEEADFFEAEITTRTGDLVDRIRVDKKTGKVQSAYQF